MQIACNCLNVVLSSEQIDKNCTSIQSNKILDSLQGSLSNLEESYHKTSRVFADCSEFLRLAYGPVTDLKSVISQNDLIYKVPVNPWCLHYCINCHQITHGTHFTNSISIINSNLLRKNEEIVSLKASKSYSSAFGLLMIDHQPTTPNLTNQFVNLLGASGSNSAGGSNDLIFQFTRSNSVSCNSSEFNQLNNKTKQQIRLRGLNTVLQNRLQKEIDDTNERIRRFTEQQFALLKNYREKTEQEYQILINLVNQVPEQLKVIDAINNLTASGKTDPKLIKHNDESANSSLSTDTVNTIDNTQQLPSVFVFKNQQVPTLDTPPATPDSTPMSVGNSPTFRQHGSNFGSNSQRNNNSVNNVGDESDCLFELEGLETYPSTVPNNMSDVEETEDGEDALGELDTGFPILKMGAQRRGSLNMARSLPISINNNFMANHVGGVPGTKFNYEDLEEEATEDAGVDIAASIKALAKSVHGDTIFGDLPRPRFSTQI